MLRCHLLQMIFRSRTPAPVLAIFLSTVLVPMAALGSNDEQAAAESFEQGKSLFKAEQFLGAAQAFREAYRLRPNWKLLYNVGQSEAAAKHYGFAIEAFEQYLAEGGDDISRDRQDQILEELDRFRGKVGELRVEGPDGSQVQVDGIARGHIPLPGILRLVAGIEHELVVTGEDGVLHRQLVRVSGRGHLVVKVGQDELPNGSADSQSSAALADEEEEGSGLSGAPSDEVAQNSAGIAPLGWALFSAGAVAAIAGAVTGGVALSKGKDLEEACPDYQCTGTNEDRSIHQSAERLAVATNVLLPVGGVLALTGIILVVVDKKKGAKGEHVIDVAPTVSATGAGVTVGGRF